MKGQTLEMELFSSEKLDNGKLFSDIMGDRALIFKDNGEYVLTYSGDFNYTA
jgi:hypothetical protein